MEDTRDHHHSLFLQGQTQEEEGITIPLPPPDAEFFQMLTQVLNNLGSQESRKTYAKSAKVFYQWLYSNGYTIKTMKRKEALEYRAWLFSDEQGYATSTSNRLLTVARVLCDEYVLSELIQKNPFYKVKGEKASDESPHVALTREQHLTLLLLPDRSTPMGSRDYAILMTLMKTGMRRKECAGLCIGDITMERGHYVAWITRKGGKRDFVELLPEVFLAIQEYLVLCGRQDASPSSPLFVQCDAGRHPTFDRLSGDGINYLVKEYARRLQLPPQPGGREATTHGVGRASAITFLLEAEVPYEKIMEVTGHKNANTMLRYRGRRDKLKDSAVKKLDF